MKILLQHTINPQVFKVTSALTSIGIPTIVWDNRQQSLYDLIIEHEPTVILCSSNITTELSNAITEFKLRTVVVDSLTNINNNRLRIRPEIYCLTDGKGYIHNETILHLDGCADLISFKHGEFKEDLKSDVTYLSDNAGLSWQQMTCLNMLCYPNAKLRFKIIGPVGVNLVAHLGNPSQLNTLSLLKSASIVLDLGGIHILDYIANGIFCISDVENPCVPHYNSSEQLLNLIDMYLDKPGKRKKILEKAKKYINDNRLTNYHKAADLCRQLNEHGYEKQLLECIV